MSAKKLTLREEMLINFKSLAKQINAGFALQGQQFYEFRKETKDEFKSVNKRFENLKSDIYSKIDKGFARKAKNHDEEIGILNNRTIELRKRMDKIESVTHL